MIKCRRPRKKDELLVCFLDLVSKIEVFTRVQDTKNKSFDEEKESANELKENVSELEKTAASLEAALKELKGRVDTIQTALERYGIL